jgi:hypothetical protein
MRVSLIVTILVTHALGAGFAVCFADVPEADIEAARLKPLTQLGSAPVVVEGVVEQPDLKDVPLPQPLSMQGARFGGVRLDASEYLKDVEILTGIPSTGFALPFVVQSRDAKR